MVLDPSPPPLAVATATIVRHNPYICVYVCIYVYTYMYLYICICIHVYLYTRLNEDNGSSGNSCNTSKPCYTYIYTYVYMCTCMRVLIRSMGAVATAATVPAIKPPATKCSVLQPTPTTHHTYECTFVCRRACIHMLHLV